MNLEYTVEYFKNLLALTAKFGVIYVTEDGNHYLDKRSAEKRSEDAMALRRVVRWCEVKKGQEPLSEKELFSMFAKQYEVNIEVDKANIVVDVPLDNEAASAEFDRRMAEREVKPKKEASK